MWVLAVLWGTLYQLIITPIRWAEKTAEEIAPPTLVWGGGAGKQGVVLKDQM